jgi:cytochrome P450
MKTISYPPGPKPKFPGSILLAFRRDPTGFLLEAARKYGDIVHFKMGSQHVFLLNHPDYIKDVLITHNRNFAKSPRLALAKNLLGEGLLTSEGDFHRRQRRLAQPAFHRQRIAAYAQVMTDYGKRMRERWQSGMTLDIAQEMMDLTMTIVAKALFNADVESEAQEIRKSLTIAIELFSRVTLPFVELINKLPLPSNRRFYKARECLDRIIYGIIRERRAQGIDQGDLLSMLLLAQDTEGDGGSMTDLQLRDELMTLFLAGHETTANALTWTWYLLSQHPSVEAKLHAELDTVLAGRLPTVEDLPRLKYTEMVFSESMRMYPPAWVISRLVLKDYEVGPYVIPANSIILMSQYVMHHDPRYFPDPFVFDPERWTPEAQAERPKFSYFPFGAGPRQCIGESFAWMEGIMLLATLGQKWKMRLVPGHPIVLQPLITLRSKYGMKMTLEQR